MDKLLEQRYEALIANYNPPEQFQWIKDLVLSQTSEHQLQIRPDATYFLIVNFSEMIVLPYAAPLPWRPHEWSAETLSPYKGLKMEDLKPKVKEALDILFNDLSRYDIKEVSAHQVLRAIDANWPPLALLFGWG
jgi:hypothetical protein